MKKTARKAAPAKVEPQPQPEPKPTKFVYVGPSILGVAVLEAAIKARPYLAGLCVPVSRLATAMQQISRGEGGVNTLYQRALAESAEIQKGAN